MSIGKTIARIEERPTDPEYGYRRDDTVLIHFTDGTALKVAGSSYESVSQDWDTLDRSEVTAWRRAAQGRREADRLTRLEREEWLAISCEERTERRERKRAKQGRFGRLLSEEYNAAYADILRSSNRMLFGAAQTIRHPCKRCGERECPNARVEVIPAGPDPFTSGFSAVVEMGSAIPKTKARRS